MRVLVVGSGAREQAIFESLSDCERYAFMSNRNPGIFPHAKEFAIGSVADVPAVTKFAQKINADLAVIGPEAPLAEGIADSLENAGITVFGPTKELAKLESSKSFTRELIENHKIQGSPKLKIFRKSSELGEARKFLDELDGFVIKPDGLTGGKGVKLSGEHLLSAAQAIHFCEELLKSGPFVIEEKLEGEEFSLQSVTDGTTVVDFPAVQDHKRAFENDTGPNTGGMGSYSDSNHLLPFLKQEHVEQAHEITQNVANALRKDFGNYKGIMYGGFMVTKNGVKLIEYNARFGQPEAMNVLPLLKTQFSKICTAVIDGTLKKSDAAFERKATVCKYIVPKGYPENPVVGEILVPKADARTFYCAVNEKDGKIITTRSRSVAFVGIADNLEAAEKIAEKAASSVKGDVYHRRDIGTAVLLQKRVEHAKRLGI